MNGGMDARPLPVWLQNIFVIIPCPSAMEAESHCQFKASRKVLEMKKKSKRVTGWGGIEIAQPEKTLARVRKELESETVTVSEA